MSESDEVREYYAQRNKLILLEAKLHDAFCKITENAYWDSSGSCDINPAIVHPEWLKIKDRIYPSLMIWQIAYMVCPFRDVWYSNNPIVGGYFSERWRVMYEMIDCIECGYIKNYQLPPEISNPSQLETASLDYKVRIKVHFDDLANAIRSGGFAYWNSKWIRLWVAHSTRSEKPKLPFSPPPELIHVQGIFNEKGFFREIEGKPFELEEVTAPEWAGIKQTYADSFLIWQEKYRHRNIHPVFEDNLEWLERNLNTERVIEIQPMYMAGDPRPPTYKLGEKPQPSTIPTTTEPPTNTPDGLPIPWLMKKIQREGGIASMLKAAYMAFRQLPEKRNPDQEELWLYLTPENLPEFISKRDKDRLILADSNRTWTRKDFLTAYPYWFNARNSE
ncbi:hypothetical protein [Thiothrix subterranea]|uniref:Uncharacterized protein n=1 Tax=Thiothrix subterranea TaxID=2735563 RepID=A0AA51MND8_9GAMM|nr:hypothetical protein [Thiothrix subterranea]MDQ5769565.1 hypothetical protein [Thiothrix subterranea]WML87148.1 hypothetical protein RCG00_02045 [Thiothrix subterranea]